MPAALASNARAERLAIDLTSPPAQKPRPAPVSTMQPTLSSAPSRWIDSSNPSRISSDSAFSDLRAVQSEGGNAVFDGLGQIGQGRSSVLAVDRKLGRDQRRLQLHATCSVALPLLGNLPPG